MTILSKRILKGRIVRVQNIQEALGAGVEFWIEFGFRKKRGGGNRVAKQSRQQVHKLL